MLDPRQEELYRAWCREASERGRVPPRTAFPRALPTLVLYEFVDNDAILLRLIGTEIVQAWGTDKTGQHLHEFMEGDYHDYIRGQIDEGRAQRVPVFSRSRFQWDRGRALDTRRLLLPYTRSERPEEVGHVLLSQIFDRSSAARPTVDLSRAASSHPAALLPSTGGSSESGRP